MHETGSDKISYITRKRIKNQDAQYKEPRSQDPKNQRRNAKNQPCAAKKEYKK
jgi:hypothetical protein